VGRGTLTLSLVSLLACSKPPRRADPDAPDAGAARDAAAVVVVPPVEDLEPAAVLPAGIVDLADIDPSIKVEMMYATADNFLGRPVAGYRDNVCYLTTEAALALREAQARLQVRAPGHGLLVRDCYRPQRAVDDFVAWAADPADVMAKATFYPDLTKPELIRQNYIAPSSGHTRGSSVDLTVVAAAGALDVGSSIDFFGERSHTAFAGISAEQRAARDLLLEVMTPAFRNYPKEWWHFVLRDEPTPPRRSPDPR